MSDGNALSNFFLHVQIPLLSVLVAFSWALIIFRLRFARCRNAEYSSHWITLSSGLIIFSGLLFTIHLVLWGVFLDRNKRVRARGLQYKPVTDDTVFSDGDLAVMVKNLNIISDVSYAMKIILPLTLWSTKLAFVMFLLGMSHLTEKRIRVALYAAAGFALAAFVVVVYMSTGYDGTSDMLPRYYAKDVKLQGLWTGLGYLWYPTWFEYVPSILNMVTDIVVTTVACIAIRSQMQASGTDSLLRVMMVITVIVSAARLGIVIALQTNTPLTNSGSSQIYLYNNLQLPAIVLTEYEVLISTTVSCLPGMRAWWRKQKGAVQKNPSPEGGLGYMEKNPRTMGHLNSLDSQELEFRHEGETV